jgi:hypothetical protein
MCANFICRVRYINYWSSHYYLEISIGNYVEVKLVGRYYVMTLLAMAIFLTTFGVTLTSALYNVHTPPLVLRLCALQSFFLKENL